MIQLVHANPNWGFYAHKKINKLAIFCLPSPLVIFYKRHLDEIERMAVLPEWRGKGLGRRLMQCAIDYAQHHAWHAIHISAQIQAQGFYQRFGFTVTSEPYLDAGIWHCDMRLQISPA